MPSDVQLIAKAEAVLDRTLAYQAAQAVHELKVTLAIDIRQINLEVSPAPHDSTHYRVVCTVLRHGDARPLQVEVLVPGPDAVKSK